MCSITLAYYRCQADRSIIFWRLLLPFFVGWTYNTTVVRQSLGTELCLVTAGTGLREGMLALLQVPSALMGGFCMNR